MAADARAMIIVSVACDPQVTRETSCFLPSKDIYAYQNCFISVTCSTM